MSRRNRVGIVVDHPTRDLPGAILLAHALAQRGVSALLIPFYEQQVDVPHLALDLIILNYARSGNLAFARRCHDAGIKIAVLDTEGGLLPKTGPTSAQSIAQFLHETGFAQSIAGYFCWGEAMAGVLRKDSGIARDAIIVTGCPRFDLAHPGWRPASAAPPGYILVNMNFPIINNRFATDGEEDRRSLSTAGLDGAHAHDLIAQFKLVRSAMVDAVARLAADFPSKGFLVRPHPFERKEYYRDRFAAFPNITVSDEGSSLEAIASAEAIVHVNCTTAIEAVMLGKLAIAVEYGNQPLVRQHAWLAASASLNVHDYDALKDAVANVADETRNFDFDTIRRERIEPYFHLSDGKAHERVCEAVLRLLDRASDGDRQRQPGLIWKRDTVLQTAYTLFAAVIGSRSVAALRGAIQRKRQGKIISISNVQGMIRQLAHVSGARPAEVRRARSRLSGAPLASIEVRPAHGAGA